MSFARSHNASPRPAPPAPARRRPRRCPAGPNPVQRTLTRPCEQRVEVRTPTVGDPRLRPVDLIPATVFRRRTTQRRRIRAGLRLRHAVRADLLTRQHPRQPAPLLLFGTERQQRMRRQSVHTDRHSNRGPARRDLLEHLQIDLVGLAAAAPLLWLGQAEQPRGTQLGEHPFWIGLGLLVRIHDRVEHLVRDVAGQRDEIFRILRRQQPVDRHGHELYPRAADLDLAVTSGSG
jgi:hypothetical protein